jgi:hypothetical protein
MAITPEDIVEQYRTDIDEYLEVVEAQIDEHLLSYYHEIITFGYISIQTSVVAGFAGATFIPAHIRKVLPNELTKLYKGWQVTLSQSKDYFYFRPPKDLREQMALSGTQKRKKKVEKKIKKQIKNRADILDIEQ